MDNRPHIKRLNYYELYSKLKFVNRFNGINLIQSESLESHISEMTGIALDLYYNVGGFDIKELIYRISIHDVDECVTVDIPRPFKYFSMEFKDLFSKTVNEYLKCVGLHDEFINDINNTKKLGLEGKLLILIDLYQVKLKFLTELSLGNSNLIDELKEVESYLDSLRTGDCEIYLNYLNKTYEKD